MERKRLKNHLDNTAAAIALKRLCEERGTSSVNLDDVLAYMMGNPEVQEDACGILELHDSLIIESIRNKMKDIEVMLSLLGSGNG
jgi:hypothetical protein